MLMEKEQEFSKKIASSYLLNSSHIDFALKNYCNNDIPSSSSDFSRRIFGNLFNSTPELSIPRSPDRIDHEQPREVSRSCSSADSEPNDNRPYKCELCGKRFRFKSNLFEHKSIHSQQSHAFVCPFCGKTCRLKGNLKKHLQVHVNSVEELEKLWQERFSRSSGRPRKTEKLDKHPLIQGLDLQLTPQLDVKTMGSEKIPNFSDMLVPITTAHTGLNANISWPIL
uniref:C2H2-type domain-containing protein n=1 Tax=Acrobeloides nanus TaxID=290746 RepID=A0A914DYD2_9BILA